MYRLGIASYLAVFLSELGVAVLLYFLLKPVSPVLSMIAMVSRLLQAAIHAVNLLNYVFPLILLHGDSYLSVFTPDQIDALVLVFQNAHHYGTLISEAFFALSLMLLGYLVYKSDLFPGILGILLVIASLAYVLDSFGIFLFPQHEELFAQIMQLPAVIGEFAFILWLLIKGVREEKAAALEPAVA
jgi:hypothetical protein